METIDPATGRRVKTFRTHGRAQVARILAAAQRAQRDWAALGFAERAVPMRRAAALLRERAEDYGRLMALEMGKPLKDGIAEAQKCALGCEHYAEHAGRYLALRDVPTDAGSSGVRYEPLGVVLAVMPWNFPFWQVFRFIAPSLMAGNAGVLKHASNVPQCALAIEAVMRDAGFPRDLFRALMIGSGAVRAVVEDPRVAAVTLTGSEPAGRAIGEAAGRALKPVVLELGGSDPFIVLAGADLERAAEVAAQARCLNSGQSCIAAKRFIVEAPVYERFLELFVARMRAVRMGDPLAPDSQIGPQARVDLRDGLHRQVRRAVRQGARLVLGGTIPKRAGAWYPPTVLVNVKPGNEAFDQEMFGPVAAVVRARNADEAVDLANASRFGLGASLWTGDAALAERLVPLIQAGSVFVNGLVKSDPRLPFGGIKASGVGRELSEEGIRAFCNVKTFWIR